MATLNAARTFKLASNTVNILEYTNPVLDYEVLASIVGRTAQIILQITIPKIDITDVTELIPF